MIEAKQKKGRGLLVFARVLGRIVLYVTLVLGLMAAVLLAFLQTNTFERALADSLLLGLHDSINAPAELGSLRLDLLSGRLLLYDLRIGSPVADLPDPLEVDLIIVDVDLGQLLTGHVDLSSVLVHRPLVTVEITEDGTSNLPELRQDEESGQGQIRLGRLDVLGGEFVFRGNRFGWGMESGRIDLGVRSGDPDTYSGRADVRGLFFNLPGRAHLVADVKAGFHLSGGEINGWAEVRERGGSTLTSKHWSYDLPSGDAEADFSLRADSAIAAEAFEFDAGGWVEAEGSVNLVDDRLFAGGTATSPAMRVGDREFDGVEARLRLDRDSLFVESFQLDALGGRFSGSAELHKLWSSPVIKGDFLLEDLDLTEVLAAADLNKAQLTSRVGANVTLQWDTAVADGLELSANLRGSWDEAKEAGYRSLVERVRSGETDSTFDSAVIPLSANGTIRLKGLSLEIAENFTAGTPISSFRLNGEVTPERMHLAIRSREVEAAEVALALTNLDRFLGRFIEGYAPPGGDRYPISRIVSDYDVSGSAVFDLTGPYNNLEMDLRVRAEGVRYAGRNLGSGALRLKWDSTGLLLDQLRFRDGDATLLVNGQVTFPPNEPVVATLEIEAAEFNLEGLEPVIGIEPIGLGGIGGGSFELNISSSISLGGRFNARSLRIGELRFERASAEVSYGDSLTLRDLEAYGPDGEELVGSIEFDPVSEDWRAALRARGVRLSSYSKLFAGGFDVRGMADLDIDASGHRFAASGVLEFSLRGLEAAGLELGDVSGLMRADGRRASLNLAIGEEEYEIEAELLGEGENQVLTVEIAEENIDLTPIVREFVPDERFYLMVGGGVSGRIPLGSESFEAELDLGRVNIGMESLSANSVGTVSVAFIDGRLHFRDVRIDQGESQITVNGSIGLEERALLNLDITGGVDLVALGDFFEDFVFSGSGELKVNIGGTLGQPALYGTASIVDAFVRHKESGIALSNISGDVDVRGSRVEIVSAGAKYSNGDVTLDGFVNIDWATLQPTAYQFNMDGYNINYSLPNELQATINGSVILQGERDSAMVTGEINIADALFTKRFDPESEILRAGQQGPLPLAAEELRGINLDLAVRGDRIVVNNNFADMELILDLRLLGSAAEPVITGRAEVREGEVFYRDRKYTITSGVIDFVNPNRFEPHFDFRAETRVKEYRIFLEFHGTFDRLYPTLSSDPAESTIDILNLLAIGKVRDNRFPSDTERLQEQLLGLALSGFVTRQVTGQLERRAEKLFGIDRFRIDPFFPGGSNNLSPRVTVGEQITDRLSVIYSRNLSELAEQVLLLEYRLSPTMLIVGSREEDGSYAVDIHLQHSFR